MKQLLNLHIKDHLIKIEDGNINFAISGDIKFNLKKNGKLITGDCYKNYNLSKNDEIDIISTNNSVYGYFAVSGGFDLKKNFGSFFYSCKIKCWCKQWK